MRYTQKHGKCTKISFQKLFVHNFKLYFFSIKAIQHGHHVKLKIFHEILINFNMTLESFRIMWFGLRTQRTLRRRLLCLQHWLVRRILQPQAMRYPMQRTRPMQKRNLPLCHWIQRQTLHIRRMPSWMFRPWSVQGQLWWCMGMQMLWWLGWKRLQHPYGAELQWWTGQWQR